MSSKNMGKVHAIYKNGVFRPLEPVDLSEGTEVELDPEVVTPPEAPNEQSLAGIYELLDRRYRSGQHDVAERHNDNQL